MKNVNKEAYYLKNIYYIIFLLSNKNKEKNYYGNLPMGSNVSKNR